jgi:hypothetical protein
VGSGRRGHASEAYQRSPHARQVPQERHFSAPLGICRRQVGQGRVRRMRGPTVPMRRLSHILRCARTARSITGPWGLALRRDSALEHLGCRHNEARTIRRPRPGGRLPGQAEAHADRLSKLVRLEFRPLNRARHVARCTPIPGACRALLGRDLKGGSQVWFLVPSKRSTRPPLTSPSAPAGPRGRGDTRRRRHRSFAAGAGHRAWTRTPASSGTPRAPTRSLRRWCPRAAVVHPTTCAPHEPPSPRGADNSCALRDQRRSARPRSKLRSKDI